MCSVHACCCCCCCFHCAPSLHGVLQARVRRPKVFGRHGVHAFCRMNKCAHRDKGHADAHARRLVASILSEFARGTPTHQARFVRIMYTQALPDLDKVMPPRAARAASCPAFGLLRVKQVHLCARLWRRSRQRRVHTAQHVAGARMRRACVQSLISMRQITELPTLLFFKGGNILQRITGEGCNAMLHATCAILVPVICNLTCFRHLVRCNHLLGGQSGQIHQASCRNC